MINPEAISLPEWLRQFGMLVGGDLPMDDARERLRAYGEALRADYAAAVFTPDSARHVARCANPKGFFPRYAEVCAALTEWAKEHPPKHSAIRGPPSAPSQWAKSVATRLANGADRGVLLSVVRTYAPPDEVRAIMAQHWPRELREEEDHAAEVRRDKARDAEQVATAVATTLRSPDALKAQRQAKPAIEPPEPDKPRPPPERLLKPDHLAAERAKAGVPKPKVPA